METRAAAPEAPLGARILEALRARWERLNVSPWAPVALVAGWAAIWAGWAASRAGWLSLQAASPRALTLAAVSATACWLSAVFTWLAVADLVRFDGRWRRGEYHGPRLAPFHPLWLPVVALVAGMAFGNRCW
jgi:hypothetical protein